MPQALDQSEELNELPEGQEEASGFQYANESGDYRDLEDVAEDLVSWLRTTAEKFAREEQFARWMEVRDTAKQHFYWRTQQHIFWSNKDGYLQAGNSSTGTGVPYGSASGSEEVDAPRFMRDFNIFTPCGRALFAALTENFPGVRFEPQLASDPLDIKAAKAKNLYRKLFERQADIRNVQRQVCRLGLTDGKIGVEVYSTESDAYYGTDSPEPVEKCRVRGALNWKTPILTQDPKQWPYAICSEDLPAVYLKSEYDWIADKIKVTPGPTLGENAWSRLSRLTVQQGTYTKLSASDAINNLTTRHEVWLAPFYDDAPEEYRDWLKAEFPEGVKLTFCGDVYCKAEAASHLKRVKWYHPLDGDGQNTPSLLLVLIAPQDIFNDFMNLMTELVEECLPRLWWDPQIFDADARREQTSEPGAGSPITNNPTPGQPIANYFFREEGGELPQQLTLIIQWISGQLCQMLSGAAAALLGAANPELGDTATAYQASADKALGVMGGPWGNLQTLFCEVISAASDLAADTRGDAKVKVSGDGKLTQQLDFADFKGNAQAYPESDSAFPQTWKQKVEQFFALLTASATSPAALGLLQKLISDPQNQDAIQNLIALDDFVWPEADARDKQLTEIDALLGSVPVPNQAILAQYQLAKVAAVTAGQPLPPPPDPASMLMSSIQPQPYDNNPAELQTCIDFINSPEGQERKKDFDQVPPEQSGWVNLLLHADAHKQRIQQPQPEGPKESMSTNFKDLPPTAQAEYLKKFGITVSTQELTDNKLLDSKAVIDKMLGVPVPGAPAQRPGEPPTNKSEGKQQ